MTKYRTGHVIDEYSVRLNTIVCVCGWKGDANEAWTYHKSKSTPIDRNKQPTAFQARHKAARLINEGE